MSWSMAVFTFLTVWWVVLFAVLPFAIERGEATGIEYAGAPKHVYWRKIMIVTTLLAALITACIAFVIHSGIMPLRGVIPSEL
jgi:predicted secreted protein